ncbi:GNAT family N-acetyltransferase [Roseivirga sp. BDSF3-8]|uniref:GNAT family N-acetyltransferase n=1 Tax=Roseivirga sp. BDSF3-8 TaxID=3241598 RepID=UPI00353214C5
MRLKPYMLLVLPEHEIKTTLFSHLNEEFGKKYFVMAFCRPEKALAFLHSRKHISRLDLLITLAEEPYGAELTRQVKNIFPKSHFLFVDERDDIEPLMPSLCANANGFLIAPNHETDSYLVPLVNELLTKASVDEHHGWHKLLPGFEEKFHKSLQVIRATTQEELTACFRLRYEVWHKEFGTLPANHFHYDYDAYDPLSVHILAVVDGVPAGTVRMIPCSLGSPVKLPCEDLFSLDPYRDRNIGEISRLVLKREHRNGITGRLMIKALLACAASEGFYDFYGSANPRYLTYYQKMGMKVLEERVMDYDNFGGLPAIPMTLRLRELSVPEMRSWGMPAKEINLQAEEKKAYVFA